MKRMLLLLLLALCGQAANAERRLKIQTRNGDVTYFTIVQGMKVYFKTGYVQIYNDYWNKVNFMLDDLDTISYDNDEADFVKGTDTDAWTAEENGGYIILHGLKGGTLVTLYNTAGVLLYSSKTEQGKPLSMPVEALPKGIYIIKAKHQTLKFQKQ